MLAPVFTDITDLRRAEREARRPCQQAERGRAWLAASAEITPDHRGDPPHDPARITYVKRAAPGPPAQVTPYLEHRGDADR
ncbi:hypothetical protein FrEUN1fDRAFT_4626 [Parafrankia sp. EUN1f]|nr:hypothetical protein FrEUN1fDRAFT_4626 [Parafrankia sp. EUN1f]